MRRETRVYPVCCQSASCGNAEGEVVCKKCSHYPKLKEFKDWVREHDAIQADATWSPSVYIATK